MGKTCETCVNRSTYAMYPNKDKCYKKIMPWVTMADTCSEHQLPVPYNEVQVGDVVEYWFCSDIEIGLVLDKGRSGHMSCGYSKNKKVSWRIPNGVWKRNIIRIIEKQAINGKKYKKYGTGS